MPALLSIVFIQAMPVYDMAGIDPNIHPQIFAFKNFLDTAVEDFVNAAQEFDEPLQTLAKMVKGAFERELQFIITGSSMPRPSGIPLIEITDPLSTAIKEIQVFRDRNRHIQEYFNHMSTISESIVALGWISVVPAPVNFVRDLRDSGQYFGNRVLATHKGDPKHANYISKWNEVLKELESYVKEYYRTGFTWGVAEVSAGLPPPPPPPPPQGGIFAVGDIANERTALLNELNQGMDITRILKPVKRDDGSGDPATPRSPAAAVAGAASVAAGPAPVAASPAPVAARVYPPKFILDGKKWRVEHQKNNYSLGIDGTMVETVAMFKCENSGVEVRNKMNGVSIDNCKRTTIVVSDIISAVEVIRCDHVKIQCNGHVPLITIDNSDSVQIFITEKSQDVEIISSKATSCNVCLLAPDGDYVELPMPEQIKTVIRDHKIHSSVIEKN